MFKISISFPTFGMKSKAAPWSCALWPDPDHCLSLETLLPQQGTVQLPSHLFMADPVLSSTLHPPLHHTAGFLALGTMDHLGLDLLCCGVCLVLCRQFSSIPNLYPPELSQPPNLKFLPALPNVLGPKLPLFRTTVSKKQRLQGGPELPS